MTPPPDTPRFEELMTNLQGVVSALENGSLGLEESLGEFERGVKLLRQCYRTLDEAELKISQLVSVDANGNVTLQPFDATATITQNEQSAGRRKRATSKTAPPPEPDAPPTDALF